jgi:penicillin-binding protein A
MNRKSVLKKYTSPLSVLALSLGTLFPASLGQVVVATPKTLPHLPVQMPSPDENGVIYIETESGKRATTIHPVLQERLTTFIKNSHAPIAAVTVLDAKTGHVLAMAQGRQPARWSGKTHTGLHTGFPAASLFKTIVATSALEMANVGPKDRIGLYGGCKHVRASGVWMKDQLSGRQNSMTLRRAFGHSCNGFFAKLSVNHVGLNIIKNFAKRYGWESGVPTDFHLEKSPFLPPTAENSSTHTVGRFAAGFGYVGLSSIHSASIMLTVANRGVVMPIRIFADTPLADKNLVEERIFSESTSERLLSIMDSSVRTYGGTASSAFRSRKLRRLKNKVGGKTGTLSGRSPKGITTWFAGMMPIKNPDIIVAAIVILDGDKWYIKGPNLAAEAFWTYEKLKKKGLFIKTAQLPTEAPPATKN